MTVKSLHNEVKPVRNDLISVTDYTIGNSFFLPKFSGVNPIIDLHYWPTPTGWKLFIMLEECSLPYQLIRVNIGKGEQFAPEFLAISPNNRALDLGKELRAGMLTEEARQALFGQTAQSVTAGDHKL